VGLVLSYKRNVKHRYTIYLTKYNRVQYTFNTASGQTWCDDATKKCKWRQMRHHNIDWTPITKCRWSHKTNMVAASQFSHVPIFQQHWWLYTVRKQNARLKEKKVLHLPLNIHAWDSGYFLKHCSIKLQILYIKAWPNTFHTVNYLNFIRYNEVYIWNSNHNNTQYNATHYYTKTLKQ
jgi:hypothetical protein